MRFLDFLKTKSKKRNAMVILLQLMTLYGTAQNNGITKDDSLNSGYIISVEIDKNEFSINGNIYVKFTINFKEDSIQYAQYDEFIKTIGPNINYYIFDRIYNNKRRESLREQYKDESEEDRRRRVTWVVLYIVFSVVFLIFAVWISWKINGK